MVGVRKRKTNRSRQVPWLLGNESTNSGDNSEVSHSSPRWKTRTRQEEGRKTEKVIAKKRNARVHPASGALRIKHDASDKETIYEIKDANKTYTIKGKELFALWKRGALELKEPVFVIYFTDSDITATINIKRGKQ